MRQGSCNTGIDQADGRVIPTHTAPAIAVTVQIAIVAATIIVMTSRIMVITSGVARMTALAAFAGIGIAFAGIAGTRRRPMRMAVAALTRMGSRVALPVPLALRRRGLRSKSHRTTDEQRSRPERY